MWARRPWAAQLSVVAITEASSCITQMPCVTRSPPRRVHTWKALHCHRLFRPSLNCKPAHTACKTQKWVTNWWNLMFCGAYRCPLGLVHECVCVGDWPCCDLKRGMLGNRTTQLSPLGAAGGSTDKELWRTDLRLKPVKELCKRALRVSLA